MRMIFFLLTILFSVNVHAAPYKCGLNGAVFADVNQCAASCGAIKCDELIAGGSNSGQCDTVKYQGFFSVSGKTYAVTKSPIEWEEEKTATIRNGLENDLIAQILSKYGISQAWIGANDPLKSADYDIVDKSRFRWRDNATITYDNWASGQPNNKLDANLIGVAPVYGEYWSVIDKSGKWSDIGLGKDGKPQKFHAVVEFNGERACVTGKNQSSSLPSDMYCSDNIAGADGLVSLDKCEVGIVFESTETANLCPKGKTACVREEREIRTEKTEQFYDITVHRATCAESVNDVNSYCFIPTNPQRKLSMSDDKMTLNILFRKDVYYVCGSEDGNNIYCTKPGEWTSISTYKFPFPVKEVKYTAKKTAPYSLNFICGGDGDQCPQHLYFGNDSKIEEQPYSEVVIASDVEQIIPDPSFTPQVGAFGSSTAQYATVLTVKYDEITYKTVYTCPTTGRPCIESAGGYYCSPYDCLDSVMGGTSSDETEEGANDDNNNGEVDEDGNCLGQIIIFPGKDTRCRLPSALTAFVGCCHEMTVADADKPDIRLSKEQVMGGIYALYLVGGPAYLWLMSLASIIDINICNGAEKQLGVNRGLKQCKYVGKYCSKRWDSQGCVQMKDTWCCFDSEFSRAFAEAGHDLLGKSWGTADNPLCSGFTPEELQQLSAMGISDHPVMQAFAESLGAQYSEKLLNEFKNNLSPTLEQDIKKEIEGMKE